MAIGVAGGAVWAAVSPRGETAAIQLEAQSTPGDNPFTSPIGQDDPAVKAPTADTSGTFSGATPGLYAAADKPSCDTGSLIAQLQADRSRAQAWAQALSINTEDIPGYAHALSPVLLRSDTAVTEHGYEPPAYNSYPAVLQAGTAVFVNGYGEPTVKCFSGNPLTRPGDLSDAGYSGARWSTFKPKAYTYVVPTRTVIVDYRYFDYEDHSIHVHQSPCAKNPGAKGCQAPNPANWCKNHPDDKICKIETGPAPGKDCSFDGKGWKCPTGFDLKNPPAPGCTVNGGDRWQCTPQIDPTKPIAAGCKAVGQEWQCDPMLDPTKNPKPGDCQPGINPQVTSHVWKCRFDPLHNVAPAKGCTLKDDGWECIPQIDPANPPGADCRADDANNKWVCPPTKGSPPSADCKPAGTGWDCPAKTDTTTPPRAGCTLGADGRSWNCPPQEDVAKTAEKGKVVTDAQNLAPEQQLCIEQGGDEGKCRQRFSGTNQPATDQGGGDTGTTGSPAGTTAGAGSSTTGPATTGTGSSTTGSSTSGSSTTGSSTPGSSTTGSSTTGSPFEPGAENAPGGKTGTTTGGSPPAGGASTTTTGGSTGTGAPTGTSGAATTGAAGTTTGTTTGSQTTGAPTTGTPTTGTPTTGAPGTTGPPAATTSGTTTGATSGAGSGASSGDEQKRGNN
ncbi:MAG TPA: DUF6777 domain-containing protein [Pseudonocardia sp.]|nr:DUF6777 domain-containing protein [Pseudonocardia sp.]